MTECIELDTRLQGWMFKSEMPGCCVLFLFRCTHPKYITVIIIIVFNNSIHFEFGAIDHVPTLYKLSYESNRVHDAEKTKICEHFYTRLLSSLLFFFVMLCVFCFSRFSIHLPSFVYFVKAFVRDSIWCLFYFCAEIFILYHSFPLVHLLLRIFYFEFSAVITLKLCVPKLFVLLFTIFLWFFYFPLFFQLNYSTLNLRLRFGFSCTM